MSIITYSMMGRNMSLITPKEMSQADTVNSILVILKFIKSATRFR